MLEPALEIALDLQDGLARLRLMELGGEFGDAVAQGDGGDDGQVIAHAHAAVAARIAQEGEGLGGRGGLSGSCGHGHALRRECLGWRCRWLRRT